MPKETVATAIAESTPAEVVAPSTTEEITGLPVQTETPSPKITGTVADLLAHKKADVVSEPKPEEAEKEKKLDTVDEKLREMLFKKPVKKKEEPKPEVEQPAPEAEKTEPEPAKPKQTKKVVVKDRAAEIRERELELERQRLELERERLELEKASRRPEPVKEEADLSLLSPEERYEFEVFQAMGGDLPKQFLATVKAAARYKAQWEKDHPGERFNPDDSDHDEFFSKNQIKYDKREFKRAEIKLANEGTTDPKLEKLEKTNRELLAKDKLRDMEQIIHESWLRNADTMVEIIDPEIVKSSREGGPEKMIKDFPVESEEIIKAAQALRAFAYESHKILDGDGLFAPENGNRVHDRILEIIRQQERLIPQQPRDQRLDADGRDFATWSQWVSMSPQQQANHWHLGAEEVTDIVARDLASRVKYELDRASKLAEARASRRASAPKGPGNEGVVKEKPQEIRAPAASPGSASKTTVDTPAKSNTRSEDNLTKIIRSGLFKRTS